jgi:murein DD-endopeptidase MepM/ murein hydrolase activator NlpD
LADRRESWKAQAERAEAAHRGRSSGGWWPLLLLACLLLTLGGLASFRVSPAATVSITPDRPGIGKRASVRVTARSQGRGLAGLRVEIVQAGRAQVLAERVHEPRAPWAFWGERVLEDTLEVEAGTASVAGLQAGEATIRVTADRAGTWLRRPDPVVEELRLEVRTAPPPLSVVTSPGAVAQGGSGLVVYRVGSHSVRDGVRVGDWWFPGFPLPERGPEARFSLFGLPLDTEGAGEALLVAMDELGNESSITFVPRLRQRRFEQEAIRLSEGFLATVVPRIVARSPGVAPRDSLLASYLEVNGDLRRRNAEKLQRLAGTSSPRVLWRGPFRPLPKAKLMSPFGSRRTYLLGGREVDRQDHLGLDLASTRHAPVPAANHGTVAFADYLGIYGNAVVLDHGCGLMTLYAHLSSLDVGIGDPVEPGQTLGSTGATGLAGGDHLHLGVLVHGLPVNPVEWLDPRWVSGRIVPKLAAGVGP